MKPNQLFQFILLSSICIVLLASCNQNNENQGNQTMKSVNWVTMKDFDFQMNDKISIQGYIHEVEEYKPGKLMITISPRRASRYQEAGEIDLFFNNSDLILGYDSVTTYRTYYSNFKGYDYYEREKGLFARETEPDSIRLTTWKIYLANGDTITDEFLNRSNLFVQGKVRDEFSKIASIRKVFVDTCYAIDSDMEETYKGAKKLDNKLAKYETGDPDEYVFSYIDGFFPYIKSVFRSEKSYSPEFSEAKGFYKIKRMTVEIGEVECGKMTRLPNNFLQNLVSFWDANLVQFRSNEKIRVYGLYNPKINKFIVEEFILLAEEK